MPKCVVIPPKGPGRIEDLTTLEQYQEAVGGWIEGIKLTELGSRHMMYVNEDGKFREDLERNDSAFTILRVYSTVLGLDDWIRGTAIIIGPPDEEGNVTDVSEKATRLALAFCD